MTCNEELEQLTVVRRLNRKQRSLNNRLRCDHIRFREETDETIAALCEIDQTAKDAFLDLWTRGGFDCDPEDYQEIIQLCLNALLQ
jgi:hypothetical protein